jgi:NAD+ kinase
MLPALSIAVDGEHVKQAINDAVLVRRTGQLQVDLSVDGEPYARLAGDGVIVATALGSSAYSMAAGGPVLAQGTDAFVATPLAIHGGSIPALVVPGDAVLQIDTHPGFDGFDVEVDGHVKPAMTAASYTITLTEARSALVCLVDPGRGFDALRRRGIISDSPRVVARDRRAEAVEDGKVAAS